VQLIRSLDALPDDLRSGAVTIGNFDGVHRGHAKIAQQLRLQAARVKGPAIVFTFDPHPVRLLRPEEAPPPLTWTDRKADLLAHLGIDAMIAYPTDDQLLSLSPEEFFQHVIVDRLDAQAIVEGPNFHFGRGRSGDVALLQKLASKANRTLEIVEPVIVKDEPVSSSRVRRLIAEGQVDQARELLTAPFRIRGMVVHGVGRGAKLGFPTANLDAIDTLLPGPGVYGAAARIGTELLPAAVNVGTNPTFGEHAPKVEVHVMGWKDPLYGQPLEVDFLSRIRNVQKFESVEALGTQLQHDIVAADQAYQRFVADMLG
jgi:riboflavin kinase / FMN adenylyltransferase